MKLTEKEIDDLIKAWTEESGELISKEEAGKMGNRVIQLLEILIQPFPGEEDTLKEYHPDISSKTPSNPKKVS